MKKIMIILYSSILALSIAGCSQENTVSIVVSDETDSIIGDETKEGNTISQDYMPSKEEVQAMRKKALDGMTEEEKERLTENIKSANMPMNYIKFSMTWTIFY